MKKSKSTTEVVLVNDFGLKPEEQKRATELLVQFPHVETASMAFRESMADAGNKYFLLCESLRETKLNGPELSLMMRALGYRKERISEVKRVISVSPEAWQKFKDGTLGFRAVLKEARAGVTLPPGEVPNDSETAEGAGDPGDVTPRNPKPAARVHRFPKAMQTELVKLVAAHELKATPGSEGYEFEFSTKGATGVKATYRFWLEVDLNGKK